MATLCATTAVVCLVTPGARAQTTWQVTALGIDASTTPMGTFTDLTSNTADPALTTITVGDSVEVIWEQSTCTNGSETIDCEHSVTETTALGNNTARTGGFDSGIQLFNFSGTGFPNEFTVGPSNLTLTGGVSSNNIYFYECFVHTVPMEGQITVRGAATHLVLGAPASVTAGSAFSVTVTAEDSGNNISPGYIKTISFSGGGTGATFPTGPQLKFTAGTSSTYNGQHTFTNGVTLTQSGMQTIMVSDGSITGSVTITVNPAATRKLVYTSIPGAATAGSGFSVQVTAEDNFNNITPSFTDTVHFASSDGQVSAGNGLPADYTFTGGGGDKGQHTFSGVTLKTAPSQTLTVSDLSNGTVTSAGPAAISVSPAATSKLVFTLVPGSATAGAAFTVQVAAEDGFNNITSGFTNTVHFTSTDPFPAVLPGDYTFVPGDNGVHTFTNGVTLKTAGLQTVTASDMTNGAITAANANINVSAAGAFNFIVTTPPSANAGAAFTAVITVKDQFGNTATGYTGTVHFTSTDGKVSAGSGLPSNYTFTSGGGQDNGIHSFTNGVILGTLGSQTITATDVGNSSITGTSSGITVSPGSATHFTVVASPTTIGAGGTVSVLVTALDSFNNTATGYGGTVHFTGGGTGATLPADYIFQVGDAGVHNFSNAATLIQTGGQVITVADSGNASINGTSNTVTVTPGAATTLIVSAPGSATAGVAFSVTVTAQDAFGNTATAYGGTIHFTTSDTNAPVLPANYTFIGGDNGVHVFSSGVTLKTATTETVSATDTMTNTITGTSGTITVGPAAASMLIVSASPGSITAGNTVMVSVTAKDQFGNSDTSDNDAVQFSSTDLQAGFPAGSLSAGGNTFIVTLRTAGSQTVSIATAGPRSTIGLTPSNGVTVTAAGATKFVVSAPPSAAAGTSFSFTVTAEDSFNNIATGYAGTVHFTSTDPDSPTLPADSTLTNGVRMFNATLKTAPSQTITATDTVTNTITGTSGTITVNAGAATHFQVNGPASTSAQSTFSITVQALDQFNNNTTVYSGTVHFISSDSDPNVNLPADSALTNGNGTFGVTLITQGPQTVTARDTVTNTITGTLNVNVTPVCTAASKTFPPSPAAIQIPGTSTPANPYPSAIMVPATGATKGFATGQTVGSLTVTLNNLTYSNTSGLALLLVHATSGRAYILMANAGNGASGATLTISDAGSGALPNNAAPIVSGIFQPTFLAGTYTAGTSLAAPAPAGPYALPATQGNATLNGTFEGDDPGGEWDLYFEDFSGGQSGQVQGGWNLTITPEEAFTNIDGVVNFSTNGNGGVPQTATTVAYPSVVKVSGLPGNVTRMTLNLNGFSAGTCFADLAIILQGPQGQFFVPFSLIGTCFGAPETNLNVTLDDAATAPLTNFSGTLISGTYKPSSFEQTQFGTPLQFNSPAPAGPYTNGTSQLAAPDGTGTFAGLFNGTNPNGNWNLFILYQPQIGGAPADSGTLASWSLTFQTDCPRATTCTLNSNQNPSVFDQPVTFSANVSSAAGTPDGSVDFDDGVTTLQTVALDGSGNASASPISNLSVGSHNVQAVYAGNGATFQVPPPNDAIPFAACTSAAPAQVVTTDPSMTALMTSGSPSSAGQSVTFTATVSSGFAGNPSTPTGTVTFLNGASPLAMNVPMSGGVAVFNTNSLPAGTLTINANYSGDATFSPGTGSVQQIVTPGAATHFSLSAPATVTAGGAFSAIVTALDQFNNVATGYAGTVHFSSTSAGSLPANSTLTNGVGTFNNVSLNIAGGQTLIATDVANGTITGSVGITVNPAAATHLVVSAPASATAGTAFTVTVTAQDQFNNTATGYTRTIHFTSSDAAAVLPANYTFVGGDNGVHTFTNAVTLKTAGSRTITATDTVTASITGTSGAITVSAAAATHLVVSAPASATAGTAFTVTVTAQDQFNNTATGYTRTIHFTSSDAAAVLPANYTFVGGDNGVHTFTNAVTLKTAGSRTVTATDTLSASITGTSGAIAVSPAAATHFNVSAPGSATAGMSFSFTVTAIDAFNNTATGYTGIVHFTSSDVAAVLPANSTLTNGTGTFNATLKTAGSRTITGTDTVTASITGTSGAIAVSPATATHFNVTAPASATSGVSFSFTVTALDAFNNTATGYTGIVHFTSSDGAAVLPGNTTLASGTGTFSATLKTAGSRTITATDTVTASITGTSATIALSSAAASKFMVTAPANATAGAAFTVTITAQDQFSNTATGYRGTVHFTTTDTNAAVLPANYTFTAGDSGVHAFASGFTLKTAGSQTVTATDTVTGSINGTSGTIVVSPAAASRFNVAAPASATAGAAFTVTVTAFDPFNNVATGYRGTVAFSGTDAQEIVPANYTFTAGDNGIHTFANALTLKTAGAQTVTLTDTMTSLVNGTSGAITVGPAAATQLLIAAPSSTTAGAGFTVTITAKDAFGNISTGFGDTVHFTSSDGQVSAGNGLPADYSFTGADAGVHSFAGVMLKTAGAQTVHVADSTNGAVTAPTANITVSPAATSKLAFTSVPASATAGVGFSVTVTAKDAFNNITPAFADAVHFASSDAKVSAGSGLPANYTFTGADAGAHSFAGVTLKTSGTQSLTVSDATTGTVTSANANITVAPAAASQLALSAPTLSGNPPNSKAGNNFVLVVTVQDAFGNTATSYTSSVHFTSTDVQAVLPADYTFVAGDSGSHVFTTTLKTVGTQTITSTDKSNGAIKGTITINVTPASTAKFKVTAPASATVGTAVSFTVTAQDNFGNTTPAYAGMAQFSSSDGAAQLPASSTLTSGTGSFNATLLSAGSQTITATDSVATSITGTSAAINVSKANSNVGVTPSITIAYFMHPAILTVTVTNTAGTGTPTGTVRLLDNGVQVSNATVALDSSGQASFSTLGLGWGDQALSVEYDGDGNFNSGTSIVITIRITPGVRPLP